MFKAYIEKSFPVTDLQYKFIKSITSDCHEHTFIFFCHLLKSTLTQIRQHRGWIPISSRIIQSSIKHADIPFLIKKGFIDTREHNRSLKQSREFKIKTYLVEKFIVLNPLFEVDDKSIQNYLSTSKLNIFDGNRISSYKNSIFYDKSRNPEPELIVEAIKKIRRTYYNQDKVLMHLKQLKIEYKQAFKVENSDYEHKFFSFLLDFYSFESILSQKPTRLNETNIYIFTPAFRILSTGRIEVIGGGLQNCSKRMKQAAYSDIDGLRIYDLGSAHAFIILSQMKTAKIECSWLENYLSNIDSKYYYAEQVGVSEPIWKRCFYAYIMGASLPNKIENAKNSSIKEYLLLETQEPKKLDKLYKNFLHVIQPLTKPLNHWYEYLLTDYLSKIKKRVGSKTYIKNQVGKARLLKDSLLEEKSKIAAFILQGYETAFIHNLTILCDKYHYEPINNEHDALYVIGKIPESAISEAQKLSGLQYLKVMEKHI